jgi:hypothetical protein
MAIGGSATTAYAVQWDSKQHKVVVLKSTTVAWSRCDSVVNACALMSKGNNALVAGPELEQVKMRMFARAAAMQAPQEEASSPNEIGA